MLAEDVGRQVRQRELQRAGAAAARAASLGSTAPGGRGTSSTAPPLTAAGLEGSGARPCGRRLLRCCLLQPALRQQLRLLRMSLCAQLRAGGEGKWHG